MFASKRNLAKKRVLVTGASSGIGRSLAYALSKERTRLILTARREDRLAELATAIQRQGGEVHFLAGDISVPEIRSRLIELASEKYGGLDVLVNNAGVGGIGTFASADATRLRWIMEVNFFAPAEMMRSAIPLLQASDDALIVNIGSVLGHCAVPKKSEYCASKFALHGLNDALRLELAKEGIDVLLISPSTTSSEFFAQALRSQGEAASNPRSMSPEQVASRTIAAIVHRRREVILSFGGRVLVWLGRFCPVILDRVLRHYG